MNSSPERTKLLRILFIAASLLLFAGCFVCRFSVRGLHPSAALIEAAATSSGDCVSGADTPSGSDAVSSSEISAPEPLSPEELNAFWDESVFIGDSVTLGLRNYVVGQRNKGNDCLSGAQFLAMGNMSYTNSLPAIGTNDAYHPKYQGKTVTIEEGVRLTSAKNVFIMLGMNDFYAYSIEIGLESAQEVVARIKEKCPDANIYIESVTPTLYDHKVFNNANIDIFNEEMEKLCGESGWTFVDVASVMKNADGRFKKEYCSDPEDLGVHMDAEGCAVWIDYLNEFIAYGGKTK